MGRVGGGDNDVGLGSRTIVAAIVARRWGKIERVEQGRREFENIDDFLRSTSPVLETVEETLILFFILI